MAPDPDSADTADSAARLEAALERIARLAHPPHPGPGPDAGPDAGPGAGPGPEAGAGVAVAERLDRIIARLHRALEEGA